MAGSSHIGEEGHAGGVGGRRRDAEHERSDVDPKRHDGQPEDETAEGHSSCGHSHQASGPDPIGEMPSGEICHQPADAEGGGQHSQLESRHRQVPAELGEEGDAEECDRGEGEDCGRHQPGLPQPSGGPE